MTAKTSDCTGSHTVVPDRTADEQWTRSAWIARTPDYFACIYYPRFASGNFLYLLDKRMLPQILPLYEDANLQVFGIPVATFCRQSTQSDEIPSISLFSLPTLSDVQVCGRTFYSDKSRGLTVSGGSHSRHFLEAEDSVENFRLQIKRSI